MYSIIDFVSILTKCISSRITLNRVDLQVSAILAVKQNDGIMKEVVKIMPTGG